MVSYRQGRNRGSASTIRGKRDKFLDRESPDISDPAKLKSYLDVARTCGRIAVSEFVSLFEKPPSWFTIVTP
jgi:hypothetical protein